MAWDAPSLGSTATGTTELVMTVPAGVSDGDLMVCCMVHKGAGFATLTGWTNVAQVLQGSTRGEMYWRRASSEPADYTATGLADTAIGYIQSWPGALASGTIVSAFTSRGNAISSEGTASLTVTGENVVIVGMSAVGGNVAPGSSPRLFDNNGPASYLMKADVTTQSATGTGCALAGASTLWAIPGATGAFDYTSGGGAAENVAILASFLPEPDATSGTFTKLYATSTLTGTRLHGLPQGAWDEARPQNRGIHHWQFQLWPYKPFGGVVNNETFGSGSLRTNGEVMFNERFITPTLDAQTLSGNFDLCLRVKVTDAAPAAMAYHLYGYITQGNTLTERTVILDNETDATAWNQTATYRQLNAPIALPSAAVTAGDRIVIEVGVVASPNDPGVTDNIGQMAWGTTDAFQIPLADAADTDTASAAAWMEFDGGLALQDFSVAAPANDACADATAIASVPYTASGIDTRGSLGPHRAVYYSYTPASTGRFFISTLGGNYSTRIRAYTGDCGSLSGVSSTTLARRIGAQGTAQTIAYVDGTAGVPYTIEIQNYTVSTGYSFSAMDAGGSLAVGVFEQSDLEGGDLFMACQHLVRLRDGVLQTGQSDFYGLIPSGLAIDYSLREMDDLNGGTDSSLRLYAGLFGSGSGNIVEILDLATLNVGESEIDFINAPLSGNEDIQSLQLSGAGMLYMGWDGDNYTWIGDLSSAAACAIRGIDAINGDNQTGAPFTASSFQATQEVQGSDYITLSADQETLFYCSAGQSILRCNIVDETQGTAFSTLPTESGPRPGLRQIAMLGAGDGTDGLLVAEGINVKRLNSAGAITQTYTPSVSARYQDIDKVILDPNGTTFWCADALSASLAEFNIETGTQVSDIETHLPPGQVSGIAIYSTGGTPVVPSFNTTTRTIRRMRRAPHLVTENIWQFFHKFELYLQTGVGLETGQGIDPQLMLRVSFDGGRTWSNERWVTAGNLGKYTTRAEWRRLGRGRDAVFEVTVSDPVLWAWIDAWLEADGGIS